MGINTTILEKEIGDHKAIKAQIEWAKWLPTDRKYTKKKLISLIEDEYTKQLLLSNGYPFRNMKEVITKLIKPRKV